MSNFLEDNAEETLMSQIMQTFSICWGKIIDPAIITNWLENFQGEVFKREKERKLALWMLLNFVFYTHDEVKYLCKSLFSSFLHRRFSAEFREGESYDSTTLDKLSKDIVQESMFYPLGNVSESGANILYYFRQVNKLPKSLFNIAVFTDFTKSNQNVKNIVLIDDVTISGSQAARYIKESITVIEDNGKKKIIPDALIGKRLFLLTFISTDEAREKIKDELRFLNLDIEILSCINLDERSKAFHRDSFVFSNLGDDYLEDTMKMIEYYSMRYDLEYAPFGYTSDGKNNAQFLFGFFYNTPDNTLPIFWSNQNGWSVIFDRYEKIYRNEYEGVMSDGIKRFV